MSIRVCQVMSADLWAGAEVQVATAASYLATRPDVTLTAVVFNDGWLASTLRGLGVNVAVVDETQHTSLGMVPAVARFLSANDVDVVHAHRPKDYLVGLLAARLAGVPHVIRTVHGLPEPMRGWSRAKSGLHRVVDRVLLPRFADRIVAVSRSVADALVGSDCSPRAVVALHNGVDLARVRATRTPPDVRRALGIGADAFVVGTAGRLTAVKGQEHLIEAAPLILRHEPNARFVFVGSGPLEGALVARTRSLGIDGACLFIDPAVDTRAGIFDLVAAFDVFVLPSLSEGSPMALLEAMALARPVVATAVGGVPEILADGETGVLVAPRSPDAIAGACVELARSGRRAATLGIAARRAVEERFSHERNGRSLMDLYRDVVREGQRRAVGPIDLMLAPVRRAAAYLGRRTQYAIEKRRVVRMRRNPAELTTRLQSARRILVVCHGNIIRSPFAARLIAKALDGKRPLSIASAGLEALNGRPPHPTAVLTAAPLQVDLSDHAASRVSLDAVTRADAIFVMDVRQLVVMRRRFPSARHKTFLLTSLAADPRLDVHDPVDGDAPVFQACYEHIVQVVGPIVHALAGHTP